MTPYYQFTPAEARHRLQTQTDYDGPWHLLVQACGREMRFIETLATTATATEYAYALAQQACHNTIYIIVKPGDTATSVVFQGQRWIE